MPDSAPIIIQIRRTLRLLVIATLVLYLALAGAGGLGFDKLSGQDRKINGNRVEQTRQSCRERNEERTLFRDKLTKPLVRYFKGQRKQTERVPGAAFEQFRPITKEEALARVDKAVRGLKAARRELHPLDCKARVRAVRDALD